MKILTGKNFGKNNKIIKKKSFFFLIVNFSCASCSANLREKMLIQASIRAYGIG
jgi:hypothetical protein